MSEDCYKMRESRINLVLSINRVLEAKAPVSPNLFFDFTKGYYSKEDFSKAMIDTLSEVPKVERTMQGEKDTDRTRLNFGSKSKTFPSVSKMINLTAKTSPISPQTSG